MPSGSVTAGWITTRASLAWAGASTARSSSTPLPEPVPSDFPFAGLPIGQAMQAVDAAMRNGIRETEGGPSETASASGHDAVGRYSPLTDWLAVHTEHELTCDFATLESVLGSPLPASARRHRPWWSNSTSSQARAWMNAGFLVSSVDLAQQRVTVRRRCPRAYGEPRLLPR